jgi:hypothetical protein
MPGVLDTFFGTPDQTQALGLLGIGMMNGGFGQGAGMAMQHLGQAPERRMRAQLMDAQLQETLAQAEERKLKKAQFDRQLEMDRLFLGGGVPGAAPIGGAPGARQPTQGGFNAQQISQQFGVPIEAVIADYRFNGGRKIAELIAERAKPNWQNVNGNLVNTNAPGFQGGFQPGVNVSNDGRATMWQPDGQGGLVVGAPRGAMDTYSAYQNISEGTKANYDPLTVTPAGQPPQMTTRGAIARNPQVQGNRIPAGVQAERDSERGMILQAELAKAREQLNNALRVGDQSAAARAQSDIAALNRELGGRSATVGMPLQSEADKLRETKGVEGDATANQARSKDVKTAEKFLSIANQAEEVLIAGPTASGIGAAADNVAAFFGQSTKGAELAQKLKALGGWMVANVPRMEGPQSNFDVDNYKIMAADVANDKLPTERRLAALSSIKAMMKSVIDGGPTGSWGDQPAPAAGGWSIREKK